MPPGPFTRREAQELLGGQFNPVGHMDLASGGTFVLHRADHAVGLDVSPSPSGKRLDAVTVCDGNFADTWRAQLSDALDALSSGETSMPHVRFRVQNDSEVKTRVWNCAREQVFRRVKHPVYAPKTTGRHRGRERVPEPGFSS